MYNLGLNDIGIVFYLQNIPWGLGKDTDMLHVRQVRKKVQLCLWVGWKLFLKMLTLSPTKSGPPLIVTFDGFPYQNWLVPNLKKKASLSLILMKISWPLKRIRTDIAIGLAALPHCMRAAWSIGSFHIFCCPMLMHNEYIKL